MRSLIAAVSVTGVLLAGMGQAMATPLPLTGPVEVSAATEVGGGVTVGSLDSGSLGGKGLVIPGSAGDLVMGGALAALLASCALGSSCGGWALGSPGAAG